MTQQSINDIVVMDGDGPNDMFSVADGRAFNALYATLATVNVKNYGAIGDGVTDDTASIQAALNYNTSLVRRVVIPDGVYRVNPVLKLSLKSNTRLEFSKGASLISKNTTGDISSMLDVVGVENIEIINPTIIGDRDTNTMITEGAGHGISCRGVKNLIIRGGNISKCFTDGIYVSAVTNGLIEFVTCDGNRRQGMSIISASNFKCRNSSFINTLGVAPGMGVDIEPNTADEVLENVMLENIYTANNMTSGIGLNLNNLNNASTVVDITINNWKDVGSVNALTVTKFNGVVSEAGTIKINDMKSINAKSAGIGIIGYKAVGTPKLSIVRPVVQNPNTLLGVNERAQNVAIAIHTDTSGYPAGVEQGNVDIIEPSIDVDAGRVLLRGIYIGYNNNFNKIRIIDPLKINIGDSANLSANSTHNLIGFASSGTCKITDKYEVITVSGGGSSIFRNYSSALYTKFIDIQNSVPLVLNEFQSWGIVDEFTVIKQSTGGSVQVNLPATVTFINEANAVVTGAYTSGDTGAVLRFKKINTGVFRITKEFGAWTVA